MNDQSHPPATLEDVRRKIDEIDTALLDLLRERFVASQEVKKIKAAAGQGKASPIRPAREAIVLRRLIDTCEEPLPVNLMVRLWREVMASSTLIQADASVHCSTQTLAKQQSRDLIRDHCGRIPLVEHSSDYQAILEAEEGDAAVAAVPPSLDWAEIISGGYLHERAIIGTLPFFDGGGVPDLLIIGQPFDEPTGQDETLVFTSGGLPRDFTPAPLWEIELDSGNRLTSLPGYLSASQTPLLGLKQRNDTLALRVLGRYPSPIKLNK